MTGKRNKFRNSNNTLQVTNLPTRPATTTNLGRPNVPDDLLLLTKEQLKIECRKRGQKTTGTKTELLQRLNHIMSGSNKRRDVTAANGSAPVQNSGLRMAVDVTVRAKEQEKKERESILIWKHPFTTLEYFVKELYELLLTFGQKLRENKKSVFVVTISILSLIIVAKIHGPHQAVVQGVYKKLLWCFYWAGLGILSSVGLGTGLHTFLLYLGPHIAQVTLAAYECGSLNFPEPPYPDEIVCPSESDSVAVTIFSIMSKVRLEAVCWGAGTALGELPPYFMAKASRLSGIDPDEEDELREFEELQRKQLTHQDLTLVEKGKLFMESIVQKVGFFGILACASIPNPLFDLAGITCGHFLVPFWTFFGATLIGKAIIKMHIQKIFVIIAFNERLIDIALEWLKVVPVVGTKLQTPFKAFLDSQKLKLHRKRGSAQVEETHSLLSSVFEKFVFAMILYFVVSIVNSLAQSYHKRIHKKKSFTKVATD